APAPAAALPARMTRPRVPRSSTIATQSVKKPRPISLTDTSGSARRLPKDSVSRARSRISDTRPPVYPGCLAPRRSRTDLDVERLAAPAGRRGRGVVDLEPAAVESVDIVDGRLVEMLEAGRVDVDLEGPAVDDLVGRVRRLGEGQAVLEPGAAAPDDLDAKPLPRPILLGEDLRDLFPCLVRHLKHQNLLSSHSSYDSGPYPSRNGDARP